MKKILVVDDHIENRYILEKLLESQQLKVITAENGKTALASAYAEPPDLIISDILMPVMDGYALCKTCKSDERLKHIPFIFYTATYTDPKDEAFALKLGADRFIIKPQEPHVFIELITEFIHSPPEPSAHRSPLGSEMEFFRQHNEILFNKLEKKMLDLEHVNQRLNREIADHKQTEEKLLRLSQAIEESPVSILLTDLSGSIEYANPKFTEVSGYAFNDILGQNATIFQSEELPSDVYEEIGETLASGKTWQGELSGRRKDGDPIWAYVTVAPIKNSQNRTTNLMAVIEDISIRRKLEDQLRHSQKMEGLGQIAGGVAHDFNNILTAIIGYASLTYQNMREDDPLRTHINNILEYSEKASTITKSLLTFSRKQATRPTLLNLNDLVNNFQKFLLRVVPANIEIRTTCTDQMLSVMADQVQIEQILMNLATNARDAMPRGGRFDMATNLVEINEEFIKTHGYGSAGRYAELMITDTGCGMDMETRGKIFEPFFTTKEQGKGTGLGLSIVYGIVKTHNGSVTVYSEVDKGTQFRILLPLAHTDEVQEKELTETSFFQGGTETILIAEDDPGIQELLTTILEDSGYNVISAADGEEAISLFKTNKDNVALVMLDGVMPKKSGKEAFNEIQMIQPGVKAIIMSGYAEHMIDLEEIKSGQAHFLQKPVLPSDILRKVRTVLDH